MMRSESEVRSMLAKVDDLDEEGQLDEAGEAIRDALLWVTGQRSDSDLEEYLEEL